MEKLRYREVNLSRSLVGKWLSLDLNPGSLRSRNQALNHSTMLPDEEGWDLELAGYS